MTNVRVLVVDDSSTMRSLICNALSRDSEIEVVGMARDPLEAREAMKALNPDVVTLDVEMPNMNGLDFLEKIMRLRPTPVIMVSNLTSYGTEETIKALEIGAFDCVAKPSPGEALMFADLPAKVKAAAAARVHLAEGRSRRTSGVEKHTDAHIDYKPDGKIVAIGASTGGVEALIAVVSQFPENCPPTVITQHMPGTFTKSFAQRLNRACAARVCEASEGAPLVVGQIYLAPGGVVHLEVGTGKQMTCRFNTMPAVNGHRPSVDVLFDSVAAAAKGRAVGVILTGMGRDGAEGLVAMRKAGARTLGQDEATSLVYGMPKVAFERGGVEKQVPLDKIGGEILRLTNRIEEGTRQCHSRIP
ncbi:MAG: protein-glutamate methylesterase/protein-glutamine glutaminase [Beijerinckiaceae bacterium]